METTRLAPKTQQSNISKDQLTKDSSFYSETGLPDGRRAKFGHGRKKFGLHCEHNHLKYVDVFFCSNYDSNRSGGSVGRLKHTVVDGDWNEDQEEEADVAQRQPPVGRNDQVDEPAGDEVHLVSHAHQHVRRDGRVQRRVVGHQDEDAVRVGRQPNVVLTDEQFQRDAAEPGEERRVVRP